MAELPQRRTIRWQGYEYAQAGAYYLTICTDDRRHWFGHISDGVMHPSAIGELAQRCWDAIPQHMPHADIGEFVVMPNHVHGIVIIRERLVDGVPDARAAGRVMTRPKPTRPALVRGMCMDRPKTSPTPHRMIPVSKCPPVHPVRWPTHPAHTHGRVMTRPNGIHGNRRASRVVRWARSWRHTNPRLRAWPTSMGWCRKAHPSGNAIIGTG